MHGKDLTFSTLNGLRMRRRILAVSVAVLLAFAWHSAGARTRVDSSTLTRKLIMGYQGWFACPDDGARLGWGHWTRGTAPAVDMLPDVAEFPPGNVAPPG